MKRQTKKLAAGAAAAAGIAAATAVRHVTKKREQSAQSMVSSGREGERQAYLIGGGLASLSAAAYLIQDGGFHGENIHIMEGMSILGGSNDGAGTMQNGFVCRGGRMLNEETYENFWDLFSSHSFSGLAGKKCDRRNIEF